MHGKNRGIGIESHESLLCHLYGAAL
jgi:hypothetical protein